MRLGFHRRRRGAERTNRLRWRRCRKGFTLTEVLISAFIAMLALSALLGGYVANIHLTDVTSSRVVYQFAVNRYIEALRQQIVTNNQFDAFWTLAVSPAQHVAGSLAGEPAFTNPSGYTGELLVRYAQLTYGTNGKALAITFDPMWRESGNRVIGADTNLNGVADAGETVDANGWLDSPFEVTIRIAKRGG